MGYASDRGEAGEPRARQAGPCLPGVRWAYHRAETINAWCRAGHWLSLAEQAELAGRGDLRRQQTWQWGRMAAKRLIRTALAAGCSLAKIEILSAEGRGRPRVRLAGDWQPWSLSISHTDRGVLAALCTENEVSLGVDLAGLESPGPGFLRLWFTDDEIAWIERDHRADRASFLWAAKEALFKACNRGEGFDPRQFEVLAQDGCRYRGRAIDACRLRSWTLDGQVAALATVGQIDANRTQARAHNRLASPFYQR